MDATLNDIDAVFLDLDGTMYLGNDLIDGALEFLERCDASGVRRFFLSNNSSRSVDQYLQKLSGLGIPATADDVIVPNTSTKKLNIAANFLVIFNSPSFSYLIFIHKDSTVYTSNVYINN